MPLNRDLQREMLAKLSEAYPRYVYFDDLEGDADDKIVNLLYLAQHGLCESGLIEGWAGSYSASQSKITARGLDFLADDGGLTAILGVVTVRLHAETIRSLIEIKIDASSTSDEEKGTLKHKLATLPETALSAATQYLVQTGLAHLPDATSWLRSLCGLG